MPSVDVVSKADLQIIYNAINNVKREISTRYDFKNVKSEIIFDRKAKCIHIVSGDDWKVKAIADMLSGQCIRFKLDPRCLDLKEIEPTSHNTVKMDIFIKEGISKETSRKIVKLNKVFITGNLHANKPLFHIRMNLTCSYRSFVLTPASPGTPLILTSCKEADQPQQPVSGTKETLN